MKILYLTTSARPMDYDAFLSKGISLSNPSNQNFHEKLIRTLSKNNDVVIGSLISPSLHGYRLISSANYHYVMKGDNPLLRALYSKNDMIRGVGKHLKGLDLIVYDSLNVSLAQAAIVLAKDHHVPAIAILTDNPNNLAKVSSLYRKRLFSLSKKAAGSLAVTPALPAIFSLEEKPTFSFMGLGEELPSSDNPHKEKPYIYFGGALLARYGVNDLIKAFIETKPDYDLVLSGHSSENKELDTMVKGKENIFLLGQISKGKHYAYLSHAELIVNPRPYDKTLDHEAVPSKLIEDLFSTHPILSTKFTPLIHEFKNDVNWIEGTSSDDIENFFKAHLDENGHFVHLKQNTAHDKAVELFSLDNVGAKIQSFFKSIKEASN